MESLVVKTVAEKALTDERLQTILDGAKENILRFAESYSEEGRAVEKKRVEVLRKLAQLFKLVEDGKVAIDTVLGQRIKDWQDELDSLTVWANSLKVPVIFPEKLLEGADLASFRDEMISFLDDTT